MGQSMQLLLLLSVAVSFNIVIAWTSNVGCPMGVGQEMISRDTSLLNPDNIVASSARSSIYADEKLVNFDFNTQNVWCTRESYETTPTFNITFSSPVVITGLMSGGYTYTSNAEYVTNFTLEYSSVLGSGGPLEFTVPEINLFLPVCPPIAVDYVHLSVLDYNVYIGDICWTLAFFGCQLPESFNMSTSSVYDSTSLYTFSSTIPGPTPSSSPSPSMEPNPGQSSSDEVKVEKDYMVVAIVLPTAILTIIIAAAIVAVGVLLCVRNNNKWSPYSRTRAGTDVTVKFVDNSELYQPGRIVQNNGEENDATGTEFSSGRDARQSETADTTYESVSPQPDTMDQAGDELMTNPLYGASGKYEEEEIKTLVNESYGDFPEREEGTVEYSYPSVMVPSLPVENKTNPYEATPF